MKAPPPPAIVISAPKPCAVETLNGPLMSLNQARDLLGAIEGLENMKSEKQGARTELRQEIQDRVHDLARGLLNWTAHE